MGVSIENGSEKRFVVSFGVTNLALLGTPSAVISQEGRTFQLEILSTTNTEITIKVSSEITLVLVAGLPTSIQVAFEDDNNNVVVFPEMDVDVIDRTNEIVQQEIEVRDQDPSSDIPVDDVDYDPVAGSEIEEYDEESEEDDEEIVYDDDSVTWGEDGEIIEYDEDDE